MAVKRAILLLEDDTNLGFMLKEHLEAHAFDVTLATDGVQGLQAARKARFSLCLVDVMMPRKDGFMFARELRGSGDETPIIFLTAKSLKEDRIEGFRVGGDDYVTKPFSVEELLLRVNAVLKRSDGTSPSAASDAIRLGGFSFDASRQRLSKGKKEIRLTAKESDLLKTLCERMNHVVERSAILTQIWGEDTIYTSRSLDVFISKLRRHLEADRSVEITSIHGVGYKLTVPSKNH